MAHRRLLKAIVQSVYLGSWDTAYESMASAIVFGQSSSIMYFCGKTPMFLDVDIRLSREKDAGCDWALKERVLSDLTCRISRGPGNWKLIYQMANAGSSLAPSNTTQMKSTSTISTAQARSCAAAGDFSEAKRSTGTMPSRHEAQSGSVALKFWVLCRHTQPHGTAIVLAIATVSAD